MVINFVIGLPGSGKSRYLKDKEFVIDDLINPQFPECIAEEDGYYPWASVDLP